MEDSEPKIKPNGEPVVVYKGKISAIVQYPMLVNQGGGYEEKMFEKACRPPGTRILAIRDNSIYLQKERRIENNHAFDWRLPGGKVFDSFAEYEEFLTKEIPKETIITAAKRELLEEAHLSAHTWEYFRKSICGATIVWDLHYLIASDILEETHNHDEGEEIIEGQWLSYDEIIEMCISGAIEEDRTVAVLLQYIKQLNNN